MSRHMNDFERFRNRRMSVDEIVELALRRERPQETPEETVTVASLEGGDLVRYRLGSEALRQAMSSMGADSSHLFHDADAWHLVARFGLLDRESGKPIALICAIGEHNGSAAAISEVSFRTDSAGDVEALLEALNELAMPATWRTGCDGQLARDCDLWFEDGRWEAREPVYLVKVCFDRTCFAVHPVARERVDVFLPFDPQNDPRQEGEAGDASVTSLIVEGLDKLQETSRLRPGFSSWSGDRKVEIVKVIRKGVESELAAEGDPAPRF